MAEFDSDYKKRVGEQIDQYREAGVIRQESPGTHFYVFRKFMYNDFKNIFGVNDHISFYAEPFAASIVKTNNPNLVSVGSGEADLERQIAAQLKCRGVKNFKFHCLEISPILIERSQKSVRDEGLEDHFEFHNLDIAEWNPTEKYAGIMAHHTLHHIVALEHLFETIKDALDKDSHFLTCDMIGRNGHMRWPEAKAIIDPLWHTIPLKQRFHNLWGRTWTDFINHDCAVKGFEGIRAQDIMPLLVKNFHFDGLLVYGGLIDVFMDVCFGPNFDLTDERDAAFIDFVAALNKQLLEAGVLTPAACFAKMSAEKTGPTKMAGGITPAMCIRLATAEDTR